MNNFKYRLLVDIFLLTSIFIFPWSVNFVLLILSTFVFDVYLEGILFAFLYEISYFQLSNSLFKQKLLPYVIVSIIILELIVKPRLRIDKQG